MNHNWQAIGRVASGGTIIDITEDASNKIWTASSGGLFKGVIGDWHPVQREIPFTDTSAILSTGKIMFAAGSAGGVAYSLDGGGKWYRSWIDQVHNPISCFAVSPNYGVDHVLLAGTLGEGVLRTTDGGRHWQLSNFGLRGFSVMSLVSVGVPQSFRELHRIKEVVFAGTDNGVYVSPNGGRGWKSAGDETSDCVVLSLALSPDFAVDQTVYAGTESGELFCSKDGGSTWERLELGSFSPGSINDLICGDGRVLLAGTSQEGILRSMDGGDTWETLLADIPPVLVLEEIKDSLYAGLYLDGMMVSDDAGKSWRVDAEFSARRFEWIKLPSDGHMIAAGLNEGLWSSFDKGKSWTQTARDSVGNAILGLAAEGDTVIVSAPDGLWRSTNRGLNWSLVLDAEKIHPSGGELSAQFHLAVKGDLVWGGGETGQLWLSEDSGQNWVSLDVPFLGLPIIALVVSPHHAEDHTLVLGVADVDKAQVQFWITNDCEAWDLWHKADSDWFNIRIGIAGPEGAETILGLDFDLLQNSSSGWETSLNLNNRRPVTAVAVSEDGALQVAAFMDEVLFRPGGGIWQSLTNHDFAEAVIGLQFSPNFDRDKCLYALTSSGMVWSCALNTS